jgi:triphosphoribosyl-dephospho-CoA synthase CitG
MNSKVIGDIIGRTALTATLYEVSAAPKPGLVDPFSRGAHVDMDFFTFLASAAALAPFFVEFSRIGSAHRREPQGLLPELRNVGIEAEKAMFAATKGANTHKGLIFSLGLLCAAAGRLVARGGRVEPEVCAKGAAEIVAGITRSELSVLAQDHGSGEQDAAKLTAGERLFLKYGVKGVRGEAEDGFPSVIGHALPRLRSDLAAGISWNDAMIDALLSLCRKVDDTTVLNRAGPEGLAYVRAKSSQALALGGMAGVQGRKFIQSLDGDFSRRGLSPGGCADLLAATIFLQMLSRELQA